MKAIIDGIRYDTDKAVEIGKADNIGTGASSWSDFNAWEAGLYKTPRSGRYFLAGEGGAMTTFSRPAGGANSRSGGSKVIPMDEQQAFEWAEAHLETETVEEYFGRLIEDA